MNEPVRYAVDDAGVCTVTMDLPGRSTNVLGHILQPALAAAVDRAIESTAVRGIIITSGKDSFVAGADLLELDKSAAAPERGLAEQLEDKLKFSMHLRKMETCGKPIVCAINGTAVGGGFEIALACHRRIVADDRRLMLGLPEVNVGLMPGGGGTQRIVRMLPLQQAASLLLQGKLLDPSAALKLGLVDKVVPPSELLVEARRWILEEGDPVAPWDKKDFKVPGGAGSLSTDVQTFFMISNAKNRASTFGNYPAPIAIAACMFEGAQLPMDRALRLEGKHFVKIFNGAVAKSMMRTLFVSKARAEKLEARPQEVPALEMRRLGIVGAGRMGSGIALAAATAGLEVILVDRDQESADKGKAYVQDRVARDLEKGKTTSAKAGRLLARVTATADLSLVRDADIVIETVFEDRDVKADVLRKLQAVVSPGTVIATNTSGMPISGLAEFCADPTSLIGMHFFSPAERMPLIEIIRGTRTSNLALARALDLTQALRKTPIVVNDGPGFFTTRFIASYVGESLRMIDQGIHPNLVENAARMIGMPMGPMTISDSIGIDSSYHAGQQNARDKGVAGPEKTIIGRLYAAGRYGIKTGKGFYDYGRGGTRKLWAGLQELIPPASEQPSVDEVKARLLYAQLAEGARCFAEGVLAGAADGDLGAILGVGFPSFLGGPYSAIDALGLPQVVAECDRLATKYGSAFALPALLREMAVDGRQFYGARAVESPGATGGRRP